MFVGSRQVKLMNPGFTRYEYLLQLEDDYEGLMNNQIFFKKNGQKKYAKKETNKNNKKYKQSTSFCNGYT